MMQPFYCSRPDICGEYEEYFVDHTGGYVICERVRNQGSASTLRTDILSTDTFLRSVWPQPQAKTELLAILAAIDMITIDAKRGSLQAAT